VDQEELRAEDLWRQLRAYSAVAQGLLWQQVPLWDKSYGSLLELLADYPLSTTSQAQLAPALASELWQDQAEVYEVVQRLELWKILIKASKSRPYVSFADFCLDYGISSSKGYARAAQGRHPRFAPLRYVAVSVIMAERLYAIEENLFAVLTLCLQLGCPEPLISQVLAEAEPFPAAMALARIMEGQASVALAELRRKWL